ncbi:hypothetical protein ACPPVQ_14940 [Diaminobutyricibacter sp. McL0618]|uniref:glycoside hydrolase family 130 protein n=1 Tax=Leifsonia sp. McL0618 TaxID=3415677 RepID=UPI003CF24C73
MQQVDISALRESYRAALNHSNAITDVISTDQFSASYDERPDWAIGPFRRDESLTFELTGQWDDPTGIGWTSDSIFNPTMIARGDELHLFYRASPRKESTASRIGHAVHRPGVGWTDDPANPVIFPTLENETLGCEDPKVYAIDGRYVMFYNAIRSIAGSPHGETMPSPDFPFGDIGCDIMIAVSDDLVSWEKRGLAVPYEVSKLWAKGAVIPRNGAGEAVRIGGEYLMFLSEGCGGVPTIGRSTDLLDWRFERQPYLDLGEVGGSLYEVACAVVGARDEHDLVLDFFYSDPDGQFAAAQALYSTNAPFTQLALNRGGSLAWGGLLQVDGDWIFAQGWDAPKHTREMYVYRSMKTERAETE